MQNLLQPQRIAFLLLATLPLFFLGCQQEPVVTDFDKMMADKVAAQNSTDSESPEFSGKPFSELGMLAEKALVENDMARVKTVIEEVRGRENLSSQMKTEVARVLFGAGCMKEAAEVYDEILEANPSYKPRFWQRGLALYYAEEYQKGVEQFESHQTFNSQDVENSVWHLLCQSRLTSVEKAREKMIKIEEDSRIPMKQVFDMFAGTGSPEEVLQACQYDKEDAKPDSAIYHGLIYIGLFHEMMGDQEASNNSMTEALRFVEPGRGLMSHVAEGHLRTRKAYPVDRDVK